MEDKNSIEDWIVYLYFGGIMFGVVYTVGKRVLEGNLGLLEYSGIGILMVCFYPLLSALWREYYYNYRP